MEAVALMTTHKTAAKMFVINVQVAPGWVCWPCQTAFARPHSHIVQSARAGGGLLGPVGDRMINAVLDIERCVTS